MNDRASQTSTEGFSGSRTVNIMTLGGVEMEVNQAEHGVPCCLVELRAIS